MLIVYQQIYEYENKITIAWIITIYSLYFQVEWWIIQIKIKWPHLIYLKDWGSNRKMLHLILYFVAVLWTFQICYFICISVFLCLYLSERCHEINNFCCGNSKLIKSIQFHTNSPFKKKINNGWRQSVYMAWWLRFKVWNRFSPSNADAYVQTI